MYETSQEKSTRLLLEWGCGALVAFDYSGIWETLSVGFAITPYHPKKAKYRSGFNLIAVCDIKNIGNNNTRSASLGFEAGFHLGDVLAFNIQAGLESSLLRTLTQI